MVLLNSSIKLVEYTLEIYKTKLLIFKLRLKDVFKILSKMLYDNYQNKKFCILLKMKNKIQTNIIYSKSISELSIR